MQDSGISLCKSTDKLESCKCVEECRNIWNVADKSWTIYVNKRSSLERVFCWC